jgi:cell division protein FtsB
MTVPADPPDAGRRPASSFQAPAGAGLRPRKPERSRLTSRAAVLAVVLCAIALSLAYPVREYIDQRRQIDQLEVQRQSIAASLSRLEAEQRRLTSNAYVEQQARDRLHMCLPTQTCYVIISPRRPAAQAAPTHVPGMPWYERLWNSVQQTDKTPAR